MILSFHIDDEEGTESEASSSRDELAQVDAAVVAPDNATRRGSEADAMTTNDADNIGNAHFYGIYRGKSSNSTYATHVYRYVTVISV